MPTTKSFILVIFLTLIWMGILMWLVLASGTAAKVGSNSFFPVVLGVFALLPLYPLYRFAKRWPRFRLGIVVLMAGLLLTLAVVFSHYVLHLDGSWVQGMFSLSEILCVLSSLLFVWQGGWPNLSARKKINSGCAILVAFCATGWGPSGCALSRSTDVKSG